MKLRDIAERDFDTFSGYALERYFTGKFVEDGACTRIGGWWDRKGENEIDIVCEDEVAGTIGFYEVKVDPRRFDAAGLARKTEAFFSKNPDKKGLRATTRLLSLADM